METLREAHASGRIMHDHCDRIPRGEAWCWLAHIGVWAAMPKHHKAETVTLDDLLHSPCIDVIKDFRIRDLLERYDPMPRETRPRAALAGRETT